MTSAWKPKWTLPNQNKNSNLKDLKVYTEPAFIHSLFIYLITILQVPYFVLYICSIKVNVFW